MTQSGNINRRQHDRFAFEHVFVLETENFSGISDTSSINVSQKGAHLVSKTRLSKGSIVSIEMPSERIQLMGEVCWVDEKNAQHYDVGVTFHEFIPVTKTKIANLIQRIQTEPETAEGRTFSFELENKVSTFLDKYVEEVRPDPIVHAPISYRRLGTPTEKTLSFYTPSKPQTLEGTTTSFRIDEEKTSTALPLRAMVLSLMALSLFFFKDTFSTNLTRWLTHRTAAAEATAAKLSQRKTLPSTSNPENQDILLNGLIEKIQWRGAADRIQVTFEFSEPVSADQLQISKINFDDHPRQLLKISNIEGTLGQKDILVGHALLNQIRMGIHEENGQKDLHVVMDLTNANVTVVDTQQTAQSLTLTLQYSPNQE